MLESKSGFVCSIARIRWLVVLIGMCALFGTALNRSTVGQDNPASKDVASNDESKPAQTGPMPDGQFPASPSLNLKADGSSRPSVWDLTVQGGIFMIPIGICSIVVVAFAIERLIGLRRSKIAPKKLVTSLKTWDLGTGGVDPRHAYDLCQMHPSALSRVIMTAIMKVGRPHSEIEKSVEDALAREADEMSHNIRPINVAISIAPLLGLLGTVQGMILAFMVTSTSSATGTAKGQELAQGIYVALVTTFAGLCVAIPGTVFASALEARIDRLLRDMEDILNGVLPQFERYEGKVRVARSRDNEGDAVTLVKPVPSQIKPAGESPRTSDSAPAPGPGKQTVVAPRSGRSE